MRIFKWSYYILPLFLIFVITVSGQDTRTKSFKVGKQGKLLVDLIYGDIVVKTWDKDEVAVRYEYDEDYEPLSIVSSGSQVKIRSNEGGSDVEVSVPSRFNVEMNTKAGDIKIAGTLVGSVKGVTSGGDIIIDKVSGFVDLLSSGGDIKANEIKGELKIVTYGGDMQLSNIDGAGIINTSGGNIRIKNLGKSVKVNTGGGNIIVDEMSGSSKLNTGGGNISIKGISGNSELSSGGGNIKSGNNNGDIVAVTASGNVHLYKVSGSAKAKSGSGDIVVELISDNFDGSHLKTSNGDIKLYIPENAKITVELKVRGYGKHYNIDERDFIRYDINPTSKNINKHSDFVSAIYLFNGGGKKIFLDTGHGGVEIRRLNK